MSPFLKVINKLYTSSLRDVVNSINARLNPQIKKKEKPEWNKIKSGFGRGMQILVDRNSFQGWQTMINGEYDRFLFEEAAKYDIKDKVVWDIGAHFGYNSLVFSKMVGSKGKVIAFEPNTFNYERLVQNIKKNKTKPNSDIEFYPYALSDISGQSLFRFSENLEGSQSTGSHLVRVSPPQAEYVYQKFGFKTVEIQTISADNFLARYPQYRPSLIKIDVEGAEYLVLQGATSLLQKHHPILFIEIHNVEAMLQVCNKLFNLGYKTNLIENSEKTLSRCFVKALYGQEI